jgi:hypothetical protein
MGYTIMIFADLFVVRKRRRATTERTTRRIKRRGVRRYIGGGRRLVNNPQIRFRLIVEHSRYQDHGDRVVRTGFPPFGKKGG